MYSDDDLSLAVKKEIFSQASVNEFKALVSSQKNSTTPDEENFKLIGGFNDIFVVIACALLLFSSLFALKLINHSLGFIVFVSLSWGLSEFFVLKKNMSLPAILLLIAFVGGTFAIISPFSTVAAAAASAIAAYVHWLRFKVPITVASGTLAGIGVIISGLLSLFPNSKDWLLVIVACCGIVSFFLAMYWDSADTIRTTRKSDVAFWLHLASAPLIIHPIFSALGVLDGNDSLVNLFFVIVLYVLLTLISITIDRRAFMVSSLAYVLYALSTVIKTYGGVGYSLALTGVLMGAVLLLISAFWQVVRKQLVAKLPDNIKTYIPKVV